MNSERSSYPAPNDSRVSINYIYDGVGVGRGWVLSIMDKKEDCWILKILRHTVFVHTSNLNLPEFTLFTTNLKLIS